MCMGRWTIPLVESTMFVTSEQLSVTAHAQESQPAEDTCLMLHLHGMQTLSPLAAIVHPSLAHMTWVA